MNEPSISLSQLGAYALWGLTVALLLVGWGVYLGHLVDMAIMLATSACITGLGATTLTIRCYARHVARLVRLSGGLPVPETRGRSNTLRSIQE